MAYVLREIIINKPHEVVADYYLKPKSTSQYVWSTFCKFVLLVIFIYSTTTFLFTTFSFAEPAEVVICTK